MQENIKLNDQKKKPKINMKQFADFLREKIGSGPVTYNDVTLDKNGDAWIRFDVHDDNFFKTHEIYIDTDGKYRIEKVED